MENPRPACMHATSYSRTGVAILAIEVSLRGMKGRVTAWCFCQIIIVVAAVPPLTVQVSAY